VIHVPVCRTVDCIFCEDLCADEKKHWKAQVQYPVCGRDPQKGGVLISFHLNGTISSTEYLRVAERDRQRGPGSSIVEESIGPDGLSQLRRASCCYS
jgi:hypothetical protein